MILNTDTSPSNEIYYVGAILLQVLKSFPNKDLDLLDVFQKLNKKMKISMNLYVLVLDWLFIIGTIKFANGSIKKCF